MKAMLLWAIILALIICFCIIGTTRGEETIPYWKVIMAEAVGEGYDGQYAVACVIRNRGGNLNGFYGAKRKDLDDFCKRQGQSYIVQAKAIERAIFEENAQDTTGGATHYEALERYGVPYWARNMQKTCKIGRHTFFRRK